MLIELVGICSKSSSLKSRLLQYLLYAIIICINQNNLFQMIHKDLDNSFTGAIMG